VDRRRGGAGLVPERRMPELLPQGRPAAAVAAGPVQQGAGRVGPARQREGRVVEGGCSFILRKDFYY
jgi:hypothetical protein